MGGRSVIPDTSLQARAMPPQKNDYGKWSVEELRRAESVAGTFLQENDARIRENFEAKLHALDELVTSLGQRRLTLDERLDCYARIAEVSGALAEDARGFFGLATEPLVARLLATLDREAR
jgi:hypothetical protein